MWSLTGALCFSDYLYYPCSVFDRGKWLAKSNLRNDNGNFVYGLNFRLGCFSEFLFRYLIVLILANNGDSGVGFDQFLTTYMPTNPFFYQLTGDTTSTGNFILLHYHPLMMPPSLIRSDLRLLRSALCLHYRILAPVIYGFPTILEEVEMVILYSTIFDLLSFCYALHEPVCCYPPLWGSIKLKFFARLMGTQSTLTMLYIQYVLRLVSLLKWKFILSSTSLWSTRINNSSVVWIVIELPGNMSL